MKVDTSWSVVLLKKAYIETNINVHRPFYSASVGEHFLFKDSKPAFVCPL